MFKSNVMNFLARRGTTLLGVAVIAFFLSGCLDDDSPAVEPVPVGYVAIYHAAPDAPGLDISIDNRRINNAPFDYTDYSGYLNFYTGNRNLKLTPSNAASALVDTTFNVADGKAYSLFVINGQSGIETLVVTDSAAAPAPGKAMVRFVHLSPDAQALDVSVEGQQAPLFANTSFRQASDFVEIDADVYSFEVKSANTVLLTANHVEIAPGRYYTIITRGFATPPAGNNNVLSLEVL